MSISTHHRALLAMAGATAAVASVLSSTAVQAAPDTRALYDGTPPATGTATDPVESQRSAPATPVGQPAPAGQPTGDSAGLAACSRTARIQADHGANKYKVSGTLSCSQNVFLRMRCKPVHRHTAYWHSHAWAFDVTEFGTSISPSSGPINGTNGDTYKANCQYWFNGASLGTLESGTINL